MRIFNAFFGIAIVSLLFFCIFVNESFASTLYLSPSSGTLYQGGTNKVQVKINTQNDSINAVSAYLSYPADKFDVISVSPSSTFGIAAELNYGNGTIKITRGNISAVSGNVTVATITFKAKNLGNASVQYIGGSAAPRASDSSDSLTSKTGAQFNIVAATPAPTPVPKDTTPPQISEMNETEITTTSATVNWKTSENTDTQLEYGIEPGKYAVTVTGQQNVTQHTVKVEGALVVPGRKIYYRIKAKDTDGNESASAEKMLQIQGYKVEVTVMDNSSPLKNAEVFLYSDPVKSETNDSGVAIFENIPSGKHLLLVKNGSLEKTKEIEVVNDQNTQNFELLVDGYKSYNNNFNLPNTYIFVGIGALLIILIAVVTFKRIMASRVSPTEEVTIYDPNANLTDSPPTAST